MDKIDLKKTVKVAFSGKKSPQIVIIPRMKYITVAGEGDPNTSQQFEEAVAVIYGMAYTMKFEAKKEEKDFVVSPLEGQWWSDDLNDFIDGNKQNWKWKVMIALPDFIEAEAFKKAREILRKKKNPPGLELAELEEMEDGPSVQVSYVGPYAEEAATIAGMHRYAEEQGYRLRSHHREVYLSDPRRTDPDKLKTIIRHPVE